MVDVFAMQMVPFEGSLILPQLISNPIESSKSKARSPLQSIVPTANSISSNSPPKKKFDPKRRNSEKFHSFPDHISSFQLKRQTSVTASNSRAGSRKNSSVFQGLRLPSNLVEESNSHDISRINSGATSLSSDLIEDDFVIFDYPTSPAVILPRIRNPSFIIPHSPNTHSSIYESAENSRRASVSSVGCNRPVETIHARADERTLKQARATTTRESISALQLSSICQNIQDREARAQVKAAFKDNELRRVFWQKVIKLSTSLIEIPSQLPEQLNKSKYTKAGKVVCKFFTIYRDKKNAQTIIEYRQRISAFSFNVAVSIILMVSMK